MDQPREVVITGVGVVSPLGVNKDAFWQSLEAGKSGVVHSLYEPTTDIPFQYFAPVTGYEPKDYIPRKTLKVMSTEIQQACGAAAMAMADAGLAKGAVEPRRFGVVLGSQMLYGDIQEVREIFGKCNVDGEFQYERWGEFAFKDLFPLWMLKYLPNMAACHIGIAHDAQGATNSIVQGDASSLLALAESVSTIERGLTDVMLTGGSGSRLALGAMAFHCNQDLTSYRGEPAGAMKPFDKRRDGLVLGEGSAALVLEEKGRAVARGAKILARIAGVSRRFESPEKPGGPTGSAIRATIQSVLEQGKLSSADIDHVNASANSTVLADRIEAQAIRATLGDTPVTALKSFFGDPGAGGGAMELIAAVLALQNGQAPRTLNYEQPDPDCPVNVIAGGSKPVTKSAVIKLSQSDTGQAAAVALVRE